MNPPIATYRLQFRGGMKLDGASALAPYVAKLGISHLYASPLFAAVAGSTHGYNCIDFASVEPQIGGDEGFDRLCAALRASGLGLLLDFVPNHMAATESNPWWRSVLEWGASSPFARHFDIDWSAPKLLLPILGVPYGDALRDGTLGLAFDAAAGAFALTCYNRHLPLTPPSYGHLLARVKDDATAALGSRFASATLSEAVSLKAALAARAAGRRARRAIEDAVSAAAADADWLNEVHEAQVWRLAYWRLAREALTYRRFFEIVGLVGLRVEDPAVFEAVHARLLQMVASGCVTGIRLDHIDGLADPKAYLERLRRASEGAGGLYLLVEKIVEAGESLRPDWPVAGTTGYEFIAALASLFVNGAREADMTRAYEAFVGKALDYEDATAAAKREIFERNLAAELAALTDSAMAIAAGDLRTRNIGRDDLRRAIVELGVALPVYRTYVDAGGPGDLDRTLIERAAGTASASRRIEDRAALDFLTALLLHDVDAAPVFATRFQQTTGPVMAKGIEDTLFYRYNRLIALNEVGGAPDRYGAPLAEFHAAMAARLRMQPSGLSATSTHDTKRGEDARARLYALSEMPDAWQEGVTRWSALNAPLRPLLPSGPAPEPNMEWLFYQALAGVWPAEWVGQEKPEPSARDLSPLRRRMRAYMVKAVREAKTRTSWTNIDDSYESAVATFVDRTLADGDGEFLEDFTETCRPIWLAGAVTSLAQLAIKLVAPGVPDFYQGAELWDFSLVDPDNRRPVDFATRQALLETIQSRDAEALIEDWKSGAPKLALTLAGLRLRRCNPTLFSDGDYLPLTAEGAGAGHILAFARVDRRSVAITVAPRLAVALTGGCDLPLPSKGTWDDTSIPLPNPLRGRPMTDALTGEVHRNDGWLPAATVLGRFPVAILS